MRIDLDMFNRKTCLNLGLQESLACKDEILEEYKKIRHEYNNMLQSIVNFVEEEDWNGLKEYKDNLLVKTHLMNRNNIIQLAKIKNNGILIMIYKLLTKAKEDGATINLIIYNDIYDINEDESRFYKALKDYVYYAYEVSIKGSKEINLKISANDQGFQFVFENAYFKDFDKEILGMRKFVRDLRTIRNIFFNTFIKNDKLIQEIVVLLK